MNQKSDILSHSQKIDLGHDVVFSGTCSKFLFYAFSDVHSCWISHKVKEFLLSKSPNFNCLAEVRTLPTFKNCMKNYLQVAHFCSLLHRPLMNFRALIFNFCPILFWCYFTQLKYLPPGYVVRWEGTVFTGVRLSTGRGALWSQVPPPRKGPGQERNNL